MSEWNNKPVIVIGMHRSGTTMLIKLLEKLGLFVGEKKRKNYESTFFQDLNRWMLAQANASWDFPLNFNYVDEFYTQQAIRVCKMHIEGLRRYQYLGRKLMLKYSSLSDIDFAWGWKDPYNTVTIDIWKRIFPEAKIIHIYRNPLDVALSLQKREQARQQNFALDKRKRFREQTLDKRWAYNQSYRILHLEEGVNLWEEYIQLATQAEKNYQADFLSIRYEDLLENPENQLSKVAGFVGLTADAEIIKAASAKIDNSRKFAFLTSKESVEYYKELKNRSLVKGLNYHEIV